MAQRYQNIMVAIDGSKEADLAFVKGVHSALRNDAKLTIAHVIDTRALQSVSTFDAEVYEELLVSTELVDNQVMDKIFVGKVNVMPLEAIDQKIEEFRTLSGDELKQAIIAFANQTTHVE